MPEAKQLDEEMKVLAAGDVHFTTTNPQAPAQAPPPVKQPSGTAAKVLAGAALGAALMGVPVAGVAGYALSKLFNKPPAPVEQKPTSDETVDIGLIRFEDLIQEGKK